MAGGMGVAKNAYIGGNLLVTSNATVSGTATFAGATGVTGLATFTNVTESTNTTTGSVIFSGGVSIQKSLSIGNAVTVTGTTTTNVLQVNSTATFTGRLLNTNTTDAVSISTGAENIAGGLSVVKSVYVGGDCTVLSSMNIGNTRSGAPSTISGTFLNVSNAVYTDTTTAAGSTNAGNYFNYFGVPTLAATNTGVSATNVANVYIAGAPILSTNQSATNNHALWVAGGNVRLSDTTDATGAGTGSLLVAGGMSVGRSIYCSANVSSTGTITAGLGVTLSGGSLRVLDATDSLSTTTGSIITAGGVAVGKTLTANTLNILLNASFSASSVITSNNLTDTSAIGNGSIVALGGVSIAKALRVGGSLFISGASTLASTSISTLNVTSPTGVSLTVAGGMTVAGATQLSGALGVVGVITASSVSASGIVTLTSTVDATTVNSGALVLQGGGIGMVGSAYVGRNLTVIGVSTFSGVVALTNTVTSSGIFSVTNTNEATGVNTGSVQTSGGISIGKSLHVQQNATVTGDLAVTGRTEARSSIIFSGYYLATPVSGTTVTITGSVSTVLISLGGTIGSLTIAFPVVGELRDGQILTVSTTHAVTTVTVTNATFAANMAFPASLSAGQVLRFLFVAGTGVWYRI